jgi:hypothetical protein
MSTKHGTVNLAGCRLAGVGSREKRAEADAQKANTTAISSVFIAVSFESEKASRPHLCHTYPKIDADFP